jgi:hypothetical protein
MHGRGEKIVQVGKSVGKRTHTEDRDVDGKMSSEWILSRLARGH